MSDQNDSKPVAADPEAQSRRATAIVQAVDGLLQEMHPDCDIAGLDIVYVTVKHDGSENHETCAWQPRDIGMSKGGNDPGILMEIAKAVAMAALKLRTKAFALREAEATDDN